MYVYVQLCVYVHLQVCRCLCVYIHNIYMHMHLASFSNNSQPPLPGGTDTTLQAENSQERVRTIRYAACVRGHHHRTIHETLVFVPLSSLKCIWGESGHCRDRGAPSHPTTLGGSLGHHIGFHPFGRRSGRTECQIVKHIWPRGYKCAARAAMRDDQRCNVSRISSASALGILLQQLSIVPYGRHKHIPANRELPIEGPNDQI